MAVPVIPRNFFGEAVIRPFPGLTNGEIDTTLFLQSSRGVIRIVEAFGHHFIPIQSDLRKNILTLQQTYDRNPRENTTIDKMISRERSTNDNSAADALLWLFRGLQFFHRFLSLVVIDSREGSPSESLIQFARIAYEDTLRQHHPWIIRQLFQVLCRFCPTRTVLTSKLVMDIDGHSHAEHHHQLMLDIERYLVSLGVAIDHVNSLDLE